MSKFFQLQGLKKSFNNDKKEILLDTTSANFEHFQFVHVFL